MPERRLEHANPAGPDAILRARLCIGCGSCAAQGRLDAHRVDMALDRYGELRPRGAPAWLREGPAAFARTCPFSPAAANESQLADDLFADTAHADGEVGRFRAAYVGHVAEPGFRERGSSGGMVSWTANELLRTGAVDAVAHVAPPDGERLFRYRLSRTSDELAAGAKSRYYPVEMSEVLETIRREPGRYAVVGVPCFVKAVQLLRREDPVMRERIVATLGLFCGHMKSTRLIESFAVQMGVPMAEVRGVDFRLKNAQRPANWYTAHFELRDGRTVQRDWFHLAEGDWGSGFFQNEACNFCDDVVSETADIAFGDAWLEPYTSDGRGTNVVIVRSARMQAMVARAIDEGRLALAPVDAAFVARTQAAGLRHRREGLAYRLSWQRARAGSVRPVKRVQADTGIAWQRKLVYRTRAAISTWSRRLFAVSRVARAPWLYLGWARAALALYHALAYSRGKLGAWFARIARTPGST
ncbi:coenzyme F420-reducing hydrogenase beta subunit [Variovorax boronicumulans]|uniref:Coenzyme F420 hydrogenase/dehydrogenase, beta subunit C-terminal domain n=1 Tax=Variovorax boronicumulans TaxID=436515 RepID=UPI002781539C|nr:Coenzyme F420 hydrogenase/dehydrogenase, beta subunit C-terminal domain [Variovorax boronicumulans]MDQ0070396.1 coenzyme F420-reducing hydrogenase beta subunit [Variovorax boronicumulans]